MRRAKESEEHLSLKKAIGNALSNNDYLIAYEECFCDIVAYDLSRGLTFGIEIERSTKNAERNIHRNFESGCNYVVCVAPNSRIANALDKKVGQLVEQFNSRIRTLTADELLSFLRNSISLKSLFEFQSRPHNTQTYCINPSDTDLDL